MKVDDCYYVGVTRKVHGIYGEVRIYFDVDDIYEYENMESVYLLLGGKLIPFFVADIRIQDPRMALVRFRDITNRDDAASLIGAELYFPLEMLPELEEDQFYFHEVIGYTLQDKHLGELGKVLRFEEMPGQDLLVMEWKGTEALIPVTREFIIRADHEKKLLLSQLPEGLLEIYTGEDEEGD